MNILRNTFVLIALALSAPISAETTAEDTPPEAPAPVAAPAAPVGAEQIAAGVCAGCHNADGNSVIPMNPILAGQQAQYITTQLMNFKGTDTDPAKRNSPVMSSMVATLSAEDMKSLGDYYAKQKTSPSQAPADEKLLATGKILYHGGNIENGVPACASCHGPTGAGIPPRYPAVSGQHAEYTLTQLNQFNTGDRDNDNKVMQKVLTRMSAQDKRAVAAYISTMR